MPQNEDWKWVWRTSAPAKVQLLIWLILHDALPTNDLRYRRGLASHAGCQRCSGNGEHILHVLRDCPHSREVWYRSGLRPTRAFFSQQVVSNWITDHTKGRNESIFLSGIWWLWCWRNNRVLGDDTWDAQQVTRRVITSAHEYTQFLNPRKITDKSGLICIRWQKPPHDVLKINVDGSYNNTSNLMYTGGLIRDSQGEWRSGFSTIDGTGDSLLAELLAIKHGLTHAWNEGARVVICESDSSEVVKLLTEQPHDLSFHSHGIVITNILAIIRRDWSLKIEHVLREANVCAYYLARNVVHQSALWKLWRDPPSLMGSLLIRDRLG